MADCPNFKGALVGTDASGKRVATIARCKSWYCPPCAEKNKKRWLAVLLNYINTHHGTGWAWFTLTAHENTHEETGEYSLKNISQMWDRLIKRMKRKYGKFQYCRVYERHESGAFHLHCIASFTFDDLVVRNEGKKNEYKDSPWLRSNARGLKIGYMTHADNLEGKETGRVAFYATKYMVKLEDAERPLWGRVRRIQTSRGIKYKSVSPSAYIWKLKSGLYLRDVAFGREGVFLINEGKVLDLDYFEGEYVWPKD